MNSYWRDWRTGDRSKDRDKLEDQEWLDKWLKNHALPEGLIPDESELEQLRELRSWLWERIQEIVMEQRPDQVQLEALNRYMLRGPVIRQIVWDNGQQAAIKLLPQCSGWDQVMAEIAASFAEALLEKEASRFRICENPDCLWVYYDDTRNRSKRYCDDKACGNLMKVRRFRARKKAEHEMNHAPEDEAE
ncbi:CGNR zinc finger domain-containing protein [Paenibacillus albidus]|uniref:CGNR zinc finger domain-containing protein n=1 Tax=Paenibacillus albidus TaxID=2041023 RepID=UPI002889707F|nr:CGNR zinc finger domain-containing protein [Paenibacillus albidus]